MKWSSLLLVAALTYLHIPAQAFGPRAERAPVAEDAPAPQETSVDTLVRRGRELLDAGQPDAALPLLEQADERGGGRLPTRTWLIRCWIARGYVNDALEATDALAAGGQSGAAVDYLYGMALHARAKQYLVQRVGGGMIEMNFRDASDLLTSATAADPVEFRDAFLPLAESAWQVQDLPRARAAAEKASELRPDGFDESYLLGRIAFSQYVAATGDAARAEDADEYWQTAYDAFVHAATTAGEPEDLARRKLLAEDHLQAAFTLVWKQRNDEASEHFSQAMAWDPSAVDFRGLWTYLEPRSIVRCLERGERGFRRIHGSEAAEDAPLLWWLGWINLELALYEEAEKAFARAVAKQPAYAECHFYIGLARYYRQDFDGAIAAIVTGCKADPQKVAGAASQNAAAYLPVLSFLFDRCASARPAKNVEAASLAELHTALAPDDALFWSYVGLFNRDAGDELRDDGATSDEQARKHAYYEKALAGYSRALELEPENPNYLNDTAVVLHYCLRRELERAKGLYEHAARRAEEELARTDLAADVRELYETARRDSSNNLAKLERELRGGREN